MASKNKIRPEKTLKLEESGIELKMSYLMLNDILRYVGAMEDAVTQIMSNQDTRDLIVRRLLTDNDKPIENMEDLIPMNEVEIDFFDVEDILAWTMEHITYFFMRTAEKIQAATQKYPEVAQRMKSLDHSENGSKPSQTKTKSAGPTE